MQQEILRFSTLALARWRGLRYGSIRLLKFHYAKVDVSSVASSNRRARAGAAAGSSFA
jgi:hypothetical protein